jgi:hypothetical protein
MIKNTVFIAFVVLIGVTLVGCVDDGGTRLKNQDPTVWLSSAPPEGTVSSYTVHLYWGGWDPDGEIRYYEWTVTDNKTGVFDPADTTGSDKWHRVFRNDSTFVFTADVLADSAGTDPNRLLPTDFIRSHTFFLRAVDDQRLPSRNPAYRSFTSRTLSPVVDIIVPTTKGSTPAQVPPISTFQWVGKDYVSTEREQQDPDSARWILLSTKRFDESWAATLDYIRDNPNAEEWSDWRYYRAAGDSGKFFTTAALEFGPYMFAVQVKDEAGAISAVFDQSRNVRRILVSQRSTGPVLNVSNKYIGTIITSSPTTPPAIIDIPANIPMEFKFSADASGYGGVASGYRYGWDIQDLSDPSQWQIDYTPFIKFCTDRKVPCTETEPRAWQFDTHTFYIEVIDNSGYTSRIAITVNVLPFTMRKNILLVDDWKENSPGLLATNGGLPSDEEHDAFWEDMLSDVKGFDPAVDVIQIDEDVPITAFSDYETVIWVATAAYNGKTRSFINNVLRFVDPTAPAATGKVTPNIVALFMSAGGHVLLCGEQIMCASINRTSFSPIIPAFPLIFRYELSGDQDGSYGDSNVGEQGIGDLSFSYQDCCVNVLDIAYISVRNAIRKAGQGCPINTVRPTPHDGKKDGLRVALPVDDKYDFPTLTLRDEVTQPGFRFAPDVNGLNCDVYNPLYFADVAKGGTSQGTCNDFAEIIPPRDCFKPIYGNGCLNQSSKVYNAPVAFWTTKFEDRIPEAGGVGARSAVMGFHPFYFKPAEMKQAIEIILFDEWKLPRKGQ